MLACASGGYEMTSFNIHLEGVEAVHKKLGKVKAVQTLIPAFNRAANLIIDRAKQYPAPPARSKYRRTQLFGRSWSAKVTHTATTPGSYSGKGLKAVIKNTAAKKGRRYGIYVMGPRHGPLPGTRQAWMHEGRWATLPGIAKRKKKAITRLMQAELNRIIKE